MILGGGTNVLLTHDITVPVLINDVKGIKIVEIKNQSVTVKIGGGEIWHNVVLWALENDLGGIENLSLIPGKTGAAPIQNIGAYGVELENVFERLDAIDLSTGRKRIFEKDECAFGYRDSTFKNKEEGRYFILYVYLNLNLPGHHKKITHYGNVQSHLNENGIQHPSIQDISQTIIHIRKSKLPNPDILPNCGSFFKNPIVLREDYNELKQEWAEIPCYPYSADEVKIPAGWLIEKCGWKGKKIGNIGCHKDHALVICNYGAKYGREIANFYKQVVSSVKGEFGIKLQTEVNVW